MIRLTSPTQYLSSTNYSCLCTYTYSCTCTVHSFNITYSWSTQVQMDTFHTQMHVVQNVLILRRCSHINKSSSLCTPLTVTRLGYHTHISMYTVHARICLIFKTWTTRTCSWHDYTRMSTPFTAFLSIVQEWDIFRGEITFSMVTIVHSVRKNDKIFTWGKQAKQSRERWTT